MADEVLSAQLDLDIAPALSNVDQLGSSIEAALANSADVFSSAFADAIGSVPDVVITPDVSAVDADITDAVAAADATPVVTPDVSSVEPDIADAVSAVDATVPVEATGTENITGDIDGAVSAADGSVTVEADTGAAASEVADLVSSVDGEDATVTVDADTSDATAALDDLGSSASGAGSAMSGASEGGENLKRSVEGVAAGAGLATGSTGELTGFVGGLGGGAAIAAGGVVALGAGIGELFDKGLEATSATQRFNLVVGDMRERVEQVHIGSLNTSLDELGTLMGSTTTQTETAAATIFQFATNAGAGREQSAHFTDELFALAARAVALNPALGDVSDVATRMEVGLGRARSAAQQFGISIAQADINTRAMADTGKTSASDLTAYEKSVAGAEIAVERYGSTLDGTVRAGAENAAIAQRRLSAEFTTFLEEAGRPLVAPGLDAIKEAIPIGESFARVFAGIGTSVLPALGASLGLVADVAGTFADVMSALGPIPTMLATGFLVFEGVTRLFPLALGGIVTGMTSITEAAPAMAAAVGISSEGIAIAEETIAAALGPVGLIAAGLAVAASAFGLFGGGADAGSAELDKFSSSVVDANGKLDETGAKAARSFLEERGALDDLGRSHVTLQTVLAATSDLTQHQVGVLTESTLQWQFGKESTREFVNSVREVNPALGAVMSQMAASGELNIGNARTLIDLAGKHAEVTAQLHNESAAHASNNELAGAAASAQQRAADAAQQAAAGAKAVATEQGAANSAFDAARDASARYAFGIGTAKDLTDALKTADQELSTELDLLFGRFLSADEATNAYKQGLADLGDKLLANGFSFDENTTAGRNNANALDAVGKQAITASGAILKSTGDVNAAKQPLIDFRTEVQNLRDKLAAAGQNTDFLDSILRNVDSAIAGVHAKVPAANAAGSALGGGVVAGIGSWIGRQFTIGQELGQQSATGAASTAPAHTAAGTGLGAGVWAGVGSWLGRQFEIGQDLGTQSAGGAASTYGAHVGTGGFLGGGLTGGLASLGGGMFFTGSGLGGSSVAGAATLYGAHWTTGAGLGGGLAGGVGSAGGAVAGAAAGAAGAGPPAAGGMYGAYYSAGAASAAGLADGIRSVAGSVIGAAQSIAAQATAALNSWLKTSSPSKVFMDIGENTGMGFAIGIENIAPRAAAAGRSLGAAAGSDVGSAWSPYTPGAGRSRGDAGASIAFNIEVHGVTDPAVARNVGEQVGEGASDALARRGYAVIARMG